MKAFLSHSSRQKLLARELTRRLPKGIEVWLDEREISVGEDIRNSIDGAYSPDLVAVILIVDNASSISPWVKLEIEKCDILEKEYNSSILIPIIVDKEAVNTPQFEQISGRNFISCYDFSDETLDSVANQLTSAILLAGTRRISYLLSSAVVAKTSDPDHELVEAIKTAVYGYREDTPLSMDELTKRLSDESFTFSSARELAQYVDALQRRGLLHGIFADDDEVYLSQESVRDKLKISIDEKRAIGKRVAREITSGSSVAIDTGSTALAFTSQLAKRLKARSVDNLEIYTTPIPAANFLIDALNDMNLDDDSKLCRINLIGGACRPRSQGTIPDEEDLNRCLPKNLDFAVIGCNGIVKGQGIGNSTNRMLAFKCEAILRADRVLFTMECQKFRINQKILIAQFDENMEIFTGTLSNNTKSIADDISKFGVKIYEC